MWRFAIVCVALCLAALGFNEWLSFKHQMRLMETAARDILNRGEMVPGFDVDRFGSRFEWLLVVAPQDYRMARVQSAGRDRKLDTDDDWYHEEVDFNKSKIVARYLGEKAKEAGKGFVQGLRRPSKFD